METIYLIKHSSLFVDIKNYDAYEKNNIKIKQ